MSGDMTHRTKHIAIAIALNELRTQKIKACKMQTKKNTIIVKVNN